MKNTVIYHSADFDGIFCREIARKFLPDAKLIGWDYGDAKIPFPVEGLVYILDLSPECLVPTVPAPPLTDCKTRMIWIDHHKSAIEKFSTDISGYRIDGVAACRLAWQWFNRKNEPAVGESTESYHGNVHVPDPTCGDICKAVPLPTKQDFVDRNVSEPLAVRLAGEYDIWDKRDPNAELFQHGLRSRDLIDDWSPLLSEHGEPVVKELLEAGEAVQFVKAHENESIITKQGFTVQWEGLTFLCCNHARFNSFLFAAGVKPEHDALLGFCFDGKQWKVSLYHVPSRTELDLSKIAVKHGGGGHKGACGFICKSLPFNL